MPDELSESFTSYATTVTPTTPGDFSGVLKLAKRHKRRRAGGAALACAAVVAIVVPIAVAISGDGKSEPSRPSPAPSATATVAPRPSARLTESSAAVPTVSSAAAPTASSAGGPPAPASSVATDTSAAVAAPFESGPPPALPLLVVSGRDSKLALVTGATSTAVGSAAGELQTPPVNTPSGLVLQDGNRVDLLTPDHRMVRLSGKAPVLHLAVSADGRYVAWGEQVVGAKGAISGVNVLYDLARRRLVHRVAAVREGGAVGILDDGRVVMFTGDGGESGVQLWQPATGAITTLSPKYLGASVAGPHTLVLFESDNDCASAVQDTHTARLLKLSGCQRLGLESPDGSRTLAVEGSTDFDLYLPGLMDRVTGQHDPRLAALLKAAGVQTARDGVWLDNEQLVLSAVRLVPGSGNRQALVLTCNVPRISAPTCTVSRDFGSVVDGTSNGRFPRPEVYVVRSASTP